MLFDNEINELIGKPDMHVRLYIFGLRRYMDTKSQIVGIKRKVSWQSLKEEMYKEPRRGIKHENPSREQIRRAITMLVSWGLVEELGDGKNLIFKCPLAYGSYSVQNKADMKPTRNPASRNSPESRMDTSTQSSFTNKADTGLGAKADTPLESNNYILLLQRFEKFWEAYPQKKSRQKAEDVFCDLAPDENQLRVMLTSLEKQKEEKQKIINQGSWAPNWKYAANWLSEKCWEDEVSNVQQAEVKHGKVRASSKKDKPIDIMFRVCSGGLTSHIEDELIIEHGERPH